MVAKILRNNWIRNIKKIPVSYLVLFIKKIWHSLAIIDGRGGGGWGKHPQQFYIAFQNYLEYSPPQPIEGLLSKQGCEQFFGGTELENGFGEIKHFVSYWLKPFSSDTPQSIKRQNKGPKEHDEKYIPSGGSK